MYRLNSTPAQYAAGSEARRAVERAQRALADASAGLSFDPAEHRYLFHGRQMASVSSIVELFAPFDDMAVAARCAKNPKHEMYGKTPEEIVSIWDARGREAADAGTVVHAFGEACFMCKTGRSGELDKALRQRLGADGLEASSPKEEAAARWWDAMDLERYVPVAMETRIVNPELGYAGTFDILFYDLLMGWYARRDYKTNGDLFRWFGGHLKAPLSIIPDNDVGKYTLQQNAYRIELENIGLHVGDMKLVWLLDDGTFEEVEIPEYEKLVRFALKSVQGEINKNSELS